MQRNGRNVDFDSYLLEPGAADVFFPTNFGALCALWQASRRQQGDAGRGGAPGVRTEVLSSAEFMNLYADAKRTKTMSAFNPLLDDFQNTAFALVDTGV